MEHQQKEQIRKLINMMGIENTIFEIVIQIIDSYRQAVPQAPDAFWQEFMKIADIDGLIDAMVPVYSDYFSEDEVAQAIQFYENPIGKKIASKLPVINKKSVEISQKWWQETVTAAVEKWEAHYNGPEKRQKGERRRKTERRFTQLLDKTR